MKIILENNNGYRWFSSDGIHFKGYFQYREDHDECKVYRELEAINILKGCQDLNQLCSFLQRVEGCFCIVIDSGENVLLAVDRARSMPLFYNESNGFVSDSAESIRKALKISKEAVDKDNYLDLVANFYLFGNKTVYSEIGQLDLGEAAKIVVGKIHFNRYYYHFGEVSSSPKEELKNTIFNSADAAFKRIKSAIGNRPVVLSMSGGYDSRFVACMLKRSGVNDVSCYSYGKKGSFEIIQAKKNAEALGFRWTCVEMSDSLMSQMLDEEGMMYIDSYTGHDFTAYVQNFAAVRKLHHEGWFKPSSVFLTGLCGDMPTGAYVKPTQDGMKYDSETASEKIYSMLFSRFDLGDEYKKRWVGRLKKEIEGYPLKVTDHQSWQSMVDCIYTSTCHVHYYLHMNTVHSFYGYEWLIPYWDSELLSAWYRVPLDLRIKQSLYEEILLNDLCAPYGIGQKKIVAGYSKKTWKRHLQYFIGGIINYILLHLGIPFKRKQDYNNFAPYELDLFRHIQSKNLINYRRSGMMQLLDHFLMERRYGIENYKYFVNNSKAL